MGALIAVLVAALALLGTPLFAIMGGASELLWMLHDSPTQRYLRFIAPNVMEERFAGSPILVTIPLFTFVGYMMAESRAPDRIVRGAAAFFGFGAASAAGVAAAFLAGAFLATPFLPFGGSFLPFSASSATASSRVISSMARLRGRLATKPLCCANGPKRPFLTSTGSPSFGCGPIERTRAAASASSGVTSGA